ncbi:non-ribosomal peptide synthetase [Streptomyces odontomachi]|uniref:non-ribosomal peptide synthetase n=1 Tax=Streptomyces odontomachi TaxID=2944940 RepID=UPI00210E0A69|nr:amino acid adenylation domain-containing protein [Streptomyces sp. ODS25]
MSYAQQRLWFLNRLEGPNATYNAPLLLQLTGRLDVPALQAAWRDVLGRHESLRTVFRDIDGEPHQVVLPADEAGLGLTVRTPPPGDAAEELRRLQVEPFDLAVDLPVRPWLVGTGTTRWVLALVTHHIVSDGWSATLLLRDLAQAYTARVQTGRAPVWEALPVQYADYTLWQRDLLGDAADPESLLSRQLGFWRGALAGMPDELSLPADRARPSTANHHGGTVRFDLGPDLAAALRTVAQQGGATLFMALQAGVAALLTRLGSGTDIPLATAVAGRTDEALDDVVGFFVNTLVLRTDTSGDPTFRQLLARVRKTDIAALDHQDVPFERLVEELNPARSHSRNPLVQVAVELHSGSATDVRMPQVACTELAGDIADAVKLDLNWDFVESGTDLRGVLGYARDLFDRETAVDLTGRLARLLREATGRPDTPLSRLPLLDEAEERTLLHDGHRTQHQDLAHGVVQRVREHAAARPEAMAVTGGRQDVTYRTLVGRASALARRLRRTAASAPGIVAVLADRGPDVVTALLGILGAGCAYLPLDTAAPPARNAARLADTHASCLLTDSGHAGFAQKVADRADHPIDVLVLDDAVDPPDDLAPVLHGPDDLAYVLFTSGSTGRPKGAMVTHRGLVNNLLGEAEAIGITDATEVVVSSAPLTFDISIWQMLTALVFGGRVHAVGQAEARDPQALFDEVIATGATVLQVVPSLLQTTLDQWDVHGGGPARLPLRRLAVTGEALPADLCRRWLARHPDVPLVNCYGPTECSDDVAQALITARTPPEGTRAPIGVATRGLRLYVLDDGLRLVPPGTPGELYVGGVGVGLGYLDDPARTATVFVPDPYGGEPGRRMYRTGDVARRRRDGQLEFLGRQDHQVKIRGRRIELGEVEFALRELAGVREAVVAVADGPGGHPVLVGYYTGTPEPADVRARLATVLTDAMVPGVLLPLDELPLTANGKVDRDALPLPDLSARAKGRPPRTARERALCRAFEETLGLDGVGADEGFFDLGGQSLLAVRLISSVNRRLDARLPLAAVFERQTPAGLAALLDEGAACRPAVTDLRREIRLDPEIRASTVPIAGPVPDPSDVLLTGATGFLGAFVLRETLERTSATVHCLVRAADDTAALRRIEAALTAYGLWEDRLRDRVVAVAGDLTQRLLGLTEKRFDALARTVDVVFHNGARVNLMESYETLRPTNVNGVQEILRLAARHRTVPVHYVSTISTVVAGEDDPEILPEDWVSDPALLDPYGYVRTKWVAEGLVRLARQRGIPTAVYRPSRIGSHAQTGVMGGDDAFWHFVRACVELGVRPEPGLDGEGLRENIVPVDFAAAAFVHLALTGRADGVVYSLTSPVQTELSAVLEHAQRLGYPTVPVPYEQWRHVLRTAADAVPGAGGSVQAVALLDSTLGETPGRYPDVFDRANTQRGLDGTGLMCPTIGPDLLEPCLAYFTRQGLLRPPPAAPDRNPRQSTASCGPSSATGRKPARR